ncbi:hypothetical protein B0H14DRAFT_2609569 [Mycena olivaceomarginata]|nr:hypothetical protein B0H14DRAFT_2609569 [Mycena olivaceomarginata]
MDDSSSARFSKDIPGRTWDGTELLPSPRVLLAILVKAQIRVQMWAEVKSWQYLPLLLLSRQSCNENLQRAEHQRPIIIGANPLLRPKLFSRTTKCGEDGERRREKEWRRNFTADPARTAGRGQKTNVERVGVADVAGAGRGEENERQHKDSRKERAWRIIRAEPPPLPIRSPTPPTARETPVGLPVRSSSLRSLHSPPSQKTHGVPHLHPMPIASRVASDGRRGWECKGSSERAKEPDGGDVCDRRENGARSGYGKHQLKADHCQGAQRRGSGVDAQPMHAYAAIRKSSGAEHGGEERAKAEDRFRAERYVPGRQPSRMKRTWALVRIEKTRSPQVVDPSYSNAVDAAETSREFVLVRILGKDRQDAAQETSEEVLGSAAESLMRSRAELDAQNRECGDEKSRSRVGYQWRVATRKHPMRESVCIED